MDGMDRFAQMYLLCRDATTNKKHPKTLSVSKPVVPTNKACYMMTELGPIVGVFSPPWLKKIWNNLYNWMVPSNMKKKQNLLDPQPLGHDDHPTPSFRNAPSCQTHGENGDLQETSFPQGPWRGWCEIPTGFVREMWVATKKTGGQIENSTSRPWKDELNWNAVIEPLKTQKEIGTCLDNRPFPNMMSFAEFCWLSPIKVLIERPRNSGVWSMDLCGVASKKALFTWKKIGRSSSFRVRPCFKAKKRPKQAWEGVIESGFGWVVHIWGSWCLYCTCWRVNNHSLQKNAVFCS